MSPIERWNQLATPNRLYLPVEPDELEIVCCDVIERTITHEGIEWNGSKFQSHALQQLRRHMPASDGFRVLVRHSGHMARIWVKDQRDGSHLEVLNQDPDTKDLTVQQVKDLRRVQGAPDAASRRTAAEGRKRLRDWSRQLLDCKNKRSKNALLRLLGLVQNDEAEAPPAPQIQPSKAKRTPDQAGAESRQADLGETNAAAGDQPSKPAKRARPRKRPTSSERPAGKTGASCDAVPGFTSRQTGRPAQGGGEPS